MEDNLPRLCGYSSFFLILTIHSLLVHGARSEVYTVGDDEGWDTGVDYGVWSQKHNFSVGDVLVFKYVKSQHDVYEVTESTFRSCDSSAGILQGRFDTGNDRVTLKEARKYWFLCSVGGHCLGGMRFGVAVSRALTNSSSLDGASSPQAQAQAQAQPPPPPPPPTQGSDNNDNGSSKQLYGPIGWSLGFCLTVFLGFIF